MFSLFLRVHAADGDEAMAEMVRHTLSKMASGGIYDQIGGGFHRYSVDERWLVPHFEKMLYDNALLARLYLDAGRALNEPEFLGVAREIFDYVLREMTSPEGGFYSAQDADSEGEEGKFFVWTPEQVDAVIGPELGAIAERYFDISIEGNFEGANIPHRTIELPDAARMFKISEDEMASKIREIHEKLFAAREQRVKPGRDEKVLVAWNAMMIGAFAEGYRALHERAVSRCGRTRGRFYHDYDVGRPCAQAVVQGRRCAVQRIPRGLCALVGAMLDVYEASLDAKYLAHARTLADVILDRFLDKENGGFFFTSDDHEALIMRSKAAFDGSTPSGNSAAVMALLSCTGTPAMSVTARGGADAQAVPRIYREAAVRIFAPARGGGSLQRGPIEVVIVGDNIARSSRMGRPARAALRPESCDLRHRPLPTLKPVSFRSRCATNGSSTAA